MLRNFIFLALFATLGKVNYTEKNDKILISQGWLIQLTSYYDLSYNLSSTHLSLQRGAREQFQCLQWAEIANQR